MLSSKEPEGQPPRHWRECECCRQCSRASQHPSDAMQALRASGKVRPQNKWGQRIGLNGFLLPRKLHSIKNMVQTLPGVIYLQSLETLVQGSKKERMELAFLIFKRCLQKWSQTFSAYLWAHLPNFVCARVQGTHYQATEISVTSFSTLFSQSY